MSRDLIIIQDTYSKSIILILPEYNWEKILCQPSEKFINDVFDVRTGL